VALQRVAVRMLFDPGFVAEVYGDPLSAAKGLGIPDGLLHQLVGNDRRLWGADPLRRSRALKALMEEFKISSTLFLALTGKVSELDRFFSSARFHDCVQRRGYMALAFADFLEAAPCGQEGDEGHGSAVLALERGMALSRRRRREAQAGRDRDAAREPGTERFVLVPGCLALALPGGTMETVQHVERYLFEASLVPALSLCDDGPRPEPLPPLTSELQYWLLEPGEGQDVSLSALELRWYEALQRCAPTAEASVLEEVVQERLRSLVSAGVVRHLGQEGP